MAQCACAHSGSRSRRAAAILPRRMSVLVSADRPALSSAPGSADDVSEVAAAGGPEAAAAPRLASGADTENGTDGADGADGADAERQADTARGAGGAGAASEAGAAGADAAGEAGAAEVEGAGGAGGIEATGGAGGSCATEAAGGCEAAVAAGAGPAAGPASAARSVPEAEDGPVSGTGVPRAAPSPGGPVPDSLACTARSVNSTSARRRTSSAEVRRCREGSPAGGRERRRVRPSEPGSRPGPLVAVVLRVRDRNAMPRASGISPSHDDLA